MKPKISAFLITYNPGRMLENCLESLRWVDELIIVDSHSTDTTVEIAKRYGAKVSLKAFIDFSEQKNAAMGLCSGDWLLSIDADEVVTDELRVEIQKLVEAADSLEAYNIRRRSVIFGKEFRFCGTQDDHPTRLFKKGAASFKNPIHEVVEVRGKTGLLKGHLKHFTYPSLEDYFTRFNRYTTLEAKYLVARKHRPGILDFVARPAGLFLKLYALKQGFRDGYPGFLFCLFSAMYVFVKYAKCRELWSAETCPQ
jgi:glycosyltransferase involved in cell wall biosynthesis